MTKAEQFHVKWDKILVQAEILVTKAKKGSSDEESCKVSIHIIKTAVEDFETLAQDSIKNDTQG